MSVGIFFFIISCGSVGRSPLLSGIAAGRRNVLRSPSAAADDSSSEDTSVHNPTFRQDVDRGPAYTHRYSHKYTLAFLIGFSDFRVLYFYRNFAPTNSWQKSFACSSNNNNNSNKNNYNNYNNISIVL